MTPALRKLHCSLPKSEVISFHYCAVNFQRKILAGFITMLSIYRGKFCPVLSSKQTRMFKLLVQWIIFFDVIMFLLHLKIFWISILSLEPWLGNPFAGEIRFSWHTSIASNGIYQNYKRQHTEHFNTVLNCSYFSYETNQM